MYGLQLLLNTATTADRMDNEQTILLPFIVVTRTLLLYETCHEKQTNHLPQDTVKW
jgi:hypothetical protein